MPKSFAPHQIVSINDAVAMAEELVSDAYKMSTNQWLRLRYDVKTLNELQPEEIVRGPFAQIVRYEGKRKDTLLGSLTYDLYKICLQDHAILKVLGESEDLRFFPFLLYILTHELIHVVRFSNFLQLFFASDEERAEEEKRVHQITRDILNPVRMGGLAEVLAFYAQWRMPPDMTTQKKQLDPA